MPSSLTAKLQFIRGKEKWSYGKVLILQFAFTYGPGTNILQKYHLA